MSGPIPKILRLSGRQRAGLFRCPGGDIVHQAGVEEALERMVALDGSVPVDAAAGAGMAQDQRAGVDHFELVAILGDGDVAGAGDCHDREHRACRLPAFGAAAGMVAGDLALDLNLHRLAGAGTDQRAAGKACAFPRQSIVDLGMQFFRNLFLRC